MKIAILCFSFKSRKTFARSGIENHPTMTFDQFQKGYRGRMATPEEIQKDKVELPGPEYKLWKTERYYVAFTGA